MADDYHHPRVAVPPEPYLIQARNLIADEMQRYDVLPELVDIVRNGSRYAPNHAAENVVARLLQERDTQPTEESPP